MSFLVAMLIGACGVGVAQQAIDAPFGLTWGATPDALRTEGIDLKAQAEQKEFGATFVASKLSRALADQEATIIAFGYDDRLWRVAAISRSFENDPNGSQVQGRYQELSKALSEKYGKPKSVHSLGDSIYRESRYFLAGIRGGNSFWYSNFETAGLSIQLGITASDSSTGYWRIIYENKPLRSAFEAARRAKEKGAL